MNDETEKAMRELVEVWERVEVEGTSEDGTDQDPERGPEDERIIAGEDVRTWLDKVFGGRAVAVVRERGEGEDPLHYPLGRVSNCETRGSILGAELLENAGHSVAPAPGVPTGVWRNDRNGWVTEQIAALTEDDAIEELVRAFQRKIPRARELEPGGNG